MEQTISELTKGEQDWVTEQIEEAARFIRRFSPEDAESPTILAAADRAFKSWLATDPTDVGSVNKVINAVGVLFGQSLVDGAGLRWVIATDQRGTDLAVFGLPGSGDVLVYPANFVAKRWERREAGFLQKSFHEILAEVRRLAAQHKPNDPKP